MEVNNMNGIDIFLLIIMEYLFNMIFIMIFEWVLLDEIFKIKLNDSKSLARAFVPLFSLINYPYILIRELFKSFKKIKKNKSKKKQDKDEREKVKYVDVIKSLHTLNHNIFEYPFVTKINEPIFNLINNIEKQYKTIINNDSFKETAFNKVQYLSTFIEECYNNKVLDDKDIINQIKEMCSATDKLLSELVKNIEDTENKVKKEVKEHLLALTKEFMDNTNSMIDDFKEFNK
jgi:hypothetical protein